MTRLSSDRVKAIISHADTEKQLVNLLRHHKIPFFLDADGIGIPSRKGILRASRSRFRFEIHSAAPVPFRPDAMEV